MRMPLLSVLLVALAALAGCGEARQKKTTLEIRDVPPDVMKVAREKLPDVTFDTAWRMENGLYEIRGKARNGKVREIDIRPDGTVEEIE